MTPKTKQRIRLIYDILLSAVTILAGICFIVSCRNLYAAGLAQGTEPYSRELVAAAFARIRIPVYLCLALVIGSFLVDIALPRPNKKLSPEKNYPLILERLRAKADLDACEPALRSAVRTQKRNRRIHIGISALLSVVCGVIFLAYACNGNNWGPPAEVTASMIRSMRLFVPCLLIPLAYIIFTAYFCRGSMRREIDLMKQAGTQAPRKAAQAARPATNRKVLLLAVRCVMVAVCIGFLIYGVSSDGVEGVIAKAVAICTECIGLG